MKRRTFVGAALAAAAGSPLFGGVRGKRWDEAAEVLESSNPDAIWSRKLPARVEPLAGRTDEIGHSLPEFR